MASLLDFNNEESRNLIRNGTNEPLSVKNYDLGTDYKTPDRPPYKYTHSVSVSEFDIDKLTISIGEITRKDVKENCIKYSYDYDGNSGPLVIRPDSPITLPYGIRKPLSEYLGNWPKGYTGKKFFDNDIDTNKPNPGTFNMELNLDELSTLRTVYDDIRSKLVKFIATNKEAQTKFSKVVPKAKGKMNLEDLIDLNVKNFYTQNNKGVNTQYLDVFTTYNEIEGRRKMAIATHFYTLHDQRPVHIHPSVCFRNKVVCLPFIYFNSSNVFNDKLNTKMIADDVAVFDIVQSSGASSTPMESLDAVADVFSKFKMSSTEQAVSKAVSTSGTSPSSRPTPVRREPSEASESSTDED